MYFVGCFNPFPWDQFRTQVVATGAAAKQLPKNPKDVLRLFDLRWTLVSQIFTFLGFFGVGNQKKQKQIALL